MTHWGWYWKIKKKHKPKATCSRFSLTALDSFDLFKNKEGIAYTRNAKDRTILEIPRYKLKAALMEDDSLAVVYDGGSYIIPVETKPCNYGGSYRFFHCPQCNARMRKLYCMEGKYLCRKCANLGYYSQRLRPNELCFYMQDKVKAQLKNHAGSLDQKPPWMKQHTFQKLRIKYVNYGQKEANITHQEIFERFGIVEDAYFPPSDLYDAYVESDATRNLIDRFDNQESFSYQDLYSKKRSRK